MLHHTETRRPRGPLAVLLLGLLCACDTTKAPATLEGDRLATPPHIIAEGGLEAGVWYVGEFEEPATATKPMSVAVKVRNVEDYEVRIQYMFEFRDKNDLPLRAQTGWRFARLPSRIETTLRGSAMELEGVKWVLRMRPAM
jgi:hypothetical protein